MAGAKTDKLLAEWHWTDRWMGSRGFLLPMEPRGVYREMLTQAWRRGAKLPNDHEAIRRAIGCTEKEWRRCWPVVAPFWRAAGAWLVNDTQLAIYAEALARREAASRRGRKGAARRWGPGKADAQVDAQASARAMASVSDLQVSTPCSPPTGGRVTRADRKQATEIRGKAWGGCRHEPRCSTFAACVEAIAQDIADRRVAVAS